MVCAVLCALAAAGCNNSSATPSPTAVTDPNEIVTQSFANLETATTLHVEGTIAGSVNINAIGALMGGLPIGLSGSIKLDGSTFSGDVDMANQALYVRAVFPSLFGLTAEVVVADGYVYFKSPMPGAKYSKTKLAASFSESLRELKSRMDAGGTTATLAGRDTIDGRDAYHLVLTVPTELLNQQMGAVASGLTATLAPVDYWVYVDTLQPARVRLKISSADLGNLDVSATLTKYGQPVSIQAPPQNQVEG